MSIFSRFTALSSHNMPAANDPLTCARIYFKRASETLSDLCYRIQVTGRLPNPAFLTEAVLQYREARARVEELEHRTSAPAVQGTDALASGQR